MSEKRSQREVNQPSTKAYNPVEYGKAKRAQEAEKQKLKEKFLEAIRELYTREKLQNPNFRLSIAILKKYVKENREKFSGITTITGLLNSYFNSSLASLEIALGIRSVDD